MSSLINVSLSNFYCLNFFATLRPYPLIQTSRLGLR